MPNFANARLAGRCDCSTKRIISSFSDAGYLIRHSTIALGPMADKGLTPHPRSCFFEQPQFQGLVCRHIFQIPGFTAKVFDHGRCRGTGCVTCQPLFARLQQLFGPTVAEALGNAFTAAELGNAVLTLQAIRNDPDLVRRSLGPTAFTGSLS